MMNETSLPTGVPPEDSPSLSAVERAIAFGIDVTLLIENLRLTPTERVKRGQQRLDDIVAGRTPPEEAWSLEKQIAELEALLELRKRSAE